MTVLSTVGGPRAAPPMASALSTAAPGKAMLIGEYAVLDGAPAVVAAVGCYARARLADGPPASPFISAAMAHAARALLQAELPLPLGVPVVDSADFSRAGRKLGLGSSAAVTVAAVGALCAAAGLHPEDPGTAALIRRVASAAHDDAQGVRGSGADVLAAALGGVRVLNDPDALTLPVELRGEVAGGLPRAFSTEPVALTLPVPVHLVATPQAASTPDLVSRYRAALQHDPAAASARDALAGAARAFLGAARSSNAPALLAAVHAAYEGYLALSAVLDVALVTPAHAALAALARDLGGAAKPSGAGGGDLAVLFLPDDARDALSRRLPAGCELLSFNVGARGVHALPADLPSVEESP